MSLSRTDAIIHAVVARLEHLRTEIETASTLRAILIDIRLKPGGYPRAVIVRPEHEWTSTTPT